MTACRVGFLCPHNSYDRNSFSGTPFFMRQALEARDDVDLVVLGGHRPPPRSRLLRRLWRRFPRSPSLPVSAEDLPALDALIAPVATGPIDRLHLSPDGPLVCFVTDATPAFLREYYGKDVPAEADTCEARVLEKVDHVIYSSAYMRDRALAEFPGLDPQRAHAVPFGLNFDSYPDQPARKPDLDPLELLFIGHDWRRKGGELALGCLQELRSQGVSARLTLIGSDSPEARADPDVIALGYLDKNNPIQAQKMQDTLARSHIFILPTRADCTPMVVAEANAYGCPVVITDVGGIGSLVRNGVNGRMLSLDAGAGDWAQVVQDMVADVAAYSALSRSSFDHALHRLTWDAWARDVVGILKGEWAPEEQGHQK